MQVPWEALLNDVLLWAVTAVVGWLAGRLSAMARHSRDEDAALKQGVRALLRSELMRTHHEAMRQGWCTTTDKEVMERMYQDYHALGGNGIATTLHDEMMRLPTRDE